MGVAQELESLMKGHNWYYDHTASGHQWRKGNEVQKKIHSLLGQVDKKVAEKLWNKYAPKNKAAGGKPMFPFPKHLTREDIIPGGKGSGTPEEKVCPKQLKVGIAVEMEHTPDPEAAKEIAIDHLVEDPEYYTKLVKSGLADEPEAIKLAKEFGLVETRIKLKNLIKNKL